MYAYTYIYIYTYDCIYIRRYIYIYMYTLVPKRVSFYTATVLKLIRLKPRNLFTVDLSGSPVVAMDGHPILFDRSMEARTGALEDDVPFQRWDFQVPCQFFVVFFESHELFPKWMFKKSKSSRIKRWFFRVCLIKFVGGEKVLLHNDPLAKGTEPEPWGCWFAEFCGRKDANCL